MKWHGEVRQGREWLKKHRRFVLANALKKIAETTQQQEEDPIRNAVLMMGAMILGGDLEPGLLGILGAL